MLIMEETQNKHKADIRIIGVGGGGSNALELMIKEGVQGAQFIAVNTDHQALEASSAATKIQLGAKLTKGLGAGANPEIGRRAAVESYEEIVNILNGANMVFVTAGMGGGTGTGGAPLVAQASKELGILTVGIVTSPFVFEGKKRAKQAQQGINELGKYVDTLIVAPNEKLLRLSEKDTPLFETFKITDNILLQAVKSIAELVSVPGLINLDFADIKTVILNKGMALMGRGVAEGSDRAKKAVFQAISSPLLEGISIEGATGMIVNITAGPSLSLIEVQEAGSALTREADDSADIIVGTVIDKNMGDKLSVTVIATGFPGRAESASIRNKLLDTERDFLRRSVGQKIKPEEDGRIPCAKKTALSTEKQEADKAPYFQNKDCFTDSKGDSPASVVDQGKEPHSGPESQDAASPSFVREKNGDTQQEADFMQERGGDAQQEAGFMQERDEDARKRAGHSKASAAEQGKEPHSSLESQDAASPSFVREKSEDAQQEADFMQERDGDAQQEADFMQERDEDAQQEAARSSEKQNKVFFLEEEEDAYSNRKSREQKNQPIEKKEEEKPKQKLSPKEKLLLKVKEYAQSRKEKNKSAKEENQMSMDWKKDSLEESLCSPFESSVDFSEKDMI